MNLPALKTELLAFMTNTTNLTATEKQKERDRCAVMYPAEFQRFLTENALPDNATNRGRFFVEKTVGNGPNGISGFWSDIFRHGSQRENEAALPVPETFE
jgi:hypothetical protein